MNKNNTEAHLKYWTDADKQALTRASSFSEMTEIALRIMRNMPRGIHVVSGPVSTGGFGNVEDNMKAFEMTVEDLHEKGINVLSWAPFEEVIRVLLKEWRKANPGAGYCMPILKDFYLPLFESGLIMDVHFIFGWESSFGSRWEHGQCVRLNINRHFLPKSSLK
jgi:hypothetical protein